MKILRITLLSIALALPLSAVLFLYNIYYSRPASGAYPTEVRVEPGDSFATVTRKLREQQVISNGLFFSLWARFNGSEKKIHQGLYRFESSVAPWEVLERLVTGKGIFHSVTIPEGLTIKEIAELLDKMQIADREKFLAAAADPSLLSALGLGDRGLEGYLFPSTYHFTPAMPERDIIMAMAEQFRKSSQPLLAKAGSTVKLSAHELLTLASIVEKETGVEAERGPVAAVFYNRLKRQMPLQSDPTVIYGLKNFNGNLTKKDLRDDNPYNTYRIRALPPGPICNPSLSSIKAVLNPPDVPYLYFVSKNDGTHTFSATIDEHNQAVKTYQPMREPARAQVKKTLARNR
ncbi:MAG TPA: endolytic transglycosylase MltG [Candidatus Binatia bacterium]|nr:endolytic transglycosylase MltG [Candidatus Binatia bacterium]